MAFLTGWDYRKQITITGQTGAGTGYQVKLLVGESSGATGENFDVESKSASFPSDKNVSGDLRFTASDGTTLLPFWVESVSGTTPNRLATIWVKVSADLGSNQNIYCYYGGTTTNVSSGSNTFTSLFTDFDGETLPEEFTRTYNEVGSYSISNSELIINGDTASRASWMFQKIDTVASFGTGIALRGLINEMSNTSSGKKFYIGFVGGTKSNTSVFNRDYHISLSKDTSLGHTSSADGVNSTDILTATSTPFIIDHKRLSSNLKLNYGSNENTKTDNVPNDNIVVSIYNTSGFETSAGNKTFKLDWLLVRKYQATEPSYNTAGIEETGVITTGNFFQLF